MHLCSLLGSNGVVRYDSIVEVQPRAKQDLPAYRYGQMLQMSPCSGLRESEHEDQSIYTVHRSSGNSRTIKVYRIKISKAIPSSSLPRFPRCRTAGARVESPASTGPRGADRAVIRPIYSLRRLPHRLLYHECIVGMMRHVCDRLGTFYISCWAAKLSPSEQSPSSVHETDYIFFINTIEIILFNISRKSLSQE